MAENQPDEQRERLITALVLIAIGAVLLVGQLTQQWEWALLILGVGFLVAYFVMRVYGFLVPAGILTGLGVGMILTSATENRPGDFEAALFLVPFGLGFILIWVLDMIYTRASNWWPLIPGGIMILVGLAVGIGGTALDLLELAGNWWPVILILIGAWTLFTLWREGGLGSQKSEGDGPDWNE